MQSTLKSPNISLGIFLSVTEVICTISIASLVKLIAGDLSVFMVLFFRYLFCIPLLLITAFYQRQKKAFLIVSKSGLAIRTITGLGSFGCLFAALQFIDLSLMTTLFQTMPIFITLLAPFLIKEVVGWFRRIVALIGFIGVLFIFEIDLCSKNIQMIVNLSFFIMNKSKLKESEASGVPSCLLAL